MKVRNAYLAEIPTLAFQCSQSSESSPEDTCTGEACIQHSRVATKQEDVCSKTAKKEKFGKKRFQCHYFECKYIKGPLSDVRTVSSVTMVTSQHEERPFRAAPLAGLSRGTRTAATRTSTTRSSACAGLAEALCG